MEDLVISKNLLKEIHFTPKQLRIEVAIYLYNSEKLSMGQAKKLAGLTQVEFQKELSSREIAIKYDISDLEEDLKNLNFK